MNKQPRRDEFPPATLAFNRMAIVFSAFIRVHLRPILRFPQAFQSPSPFWLRPRRAALICGQTRFRPPKEYLDAQKFLPRLEAA
jgi:hypothetical protein